MSHFQLGFICGVFFCTAVISGLSLMQDKSAMEAALEYQAYQSCIADNRCEMTQQNWNDYYTLKQEIFEEGEEN